MKKILVRIIGAIFLLAAVFVMFATPWLQINDINRKELREFRAIATEDLEMTQDILLEGIEMSEDFEDDLKDNDLPYSKGKIKSRIKDVDGLLKSLADTEISFQEVTSLAFTAPGLIADTENFLETEVSAYIFEESQLVTTEDIDEVLDNMMGLDIVFYLVGAVIILFVALGVVSAITHCLNKARFIKYIYIVFLVLLVVGLCVVLPMVSDIIQSEGNFTEGAEDISLGITVMPFIAVALTVVPVVLDIIFERKNKTKTEEQTNG